MMFRRAGAMRCNYFVLHQRNLQRWMEEEGGKLFLWVPGVWCPQLLGGGQGFRALLDMQRDAQGAVWKLLTASAASIFVYMYMKASRDPWLYTWASGPLLKARAEGVGEALLGLTGKLERNWLWEGSTSVKLVWKLSLAARAVLTWTQALHLSVDLVPLPAEGILTHNHPIWLLQANTLQVCGLLWSLSCCGWS